MRSGRTPCLLFVECLVEIQGRPALARARLASAVYTHDIGILTVSHSRPNTVAHQGRRPVRSLAGVKMCP